MQSENRNQKERRARLLRLLKVVQKHVEAKGKPVKLNGSSRRFNMLRWDCGTSACAFGSYAISSYGKKHFKAIGGDVTHRFFLQKDDPRQVLSPFASGTLAAAAEHFNISRREAEQVFLPQGYEDDGYNVLSIPPEAVVRRIKELLGKYEQGRGDVQKLKRRLMYRHFGFEITDAS